MAIKIINKKDIIDNNHLHKFTLNEISILKTLDHSNIIRLVELIKTENNYYIVYEFINGGSLDQFLSNIVVDQHTYD